MPKCQHVKLVRRGGKWVCEKCHRLPAPDIPYKFVDDGDNGSHWIRKEKA